MKTNYFLFLCLWAPFFLHAQGFELIFGSTSDDFGRKTIQIPNENAYLVLYDRSGNQPEDNGIGITKIDSLGNVVWEKFDNAEFGFWNDADFVLDNDGFRLAYPEYINGNSFLKVKKYDFEGEVINDGTYSLPLFSDLEMVRFLPDNSVIGIGISFWNDVSELYKVSQNGDLIWLKSFPISQFNSYQCQDFQPATDGGFLSISKTYFSGDSTLLTKFDALGTMLWQSTLPPEVGFETFIMPFPDGNSYFVWGENDVTAGFGTFISRVDNNGQILWHQDFTPHCNFIKNKGVIHGEGNSLYLTGKVYTSSDDKFVLLKLGEDGSIIWEKQYGEFNSNNEGQLLRDSDGGFFIAAESYPGQGFSSDPYMIKTDSNGELIWKWYTAKPGSYKQADAILTSDGGYLVLGYSYENFGDDYNCQLTKLDANGIVYTNFISGQLVYDTDQSCSQNNGEQTLANWKVKATGPQTTYATTFPDGSFWLSTNDDSVLVSALPPNTLWANCPDPVYAVFSEPFDTATVALFAQVTKYCPILEVSASTPFLRRCFNNTYAIKVENTGTVSAENIQAKVFLDPFLTYLGASVPLISQNGLEYIFDIGNLDINHQVNFTITVEVSCDAELGQEHCLSVTAIADNTCPDVDNSLAHTRDCQPNVGSFDPNDKRAFSEGALTERLIPADSTIEYQIRFQNTGTDTAFTIVVVDTLSSLLDIESIRAGASSHAYHLELERNNILKFVFEDIMLPDSNVNEPASHGFVKFRINHKPGLVPGDVIANQAGIFFDFNEAVITNHLELEIEGPSTVRPEKPSAELLKIYPQPAGTVVVFELLVDAGPQPWRLEVLNILGQMLHDQPIQTGANPIAMLPAGQHYYRLWQNGRPVETGKLVIFK